MYKYRATRIEYQKKYRASHKEHLKKYFKDYYAKNKSVLNTRVKKWQAKQRLENNEEWNAKKRAYRNKNKAHVRKYFKKYAAEHPEKILEYKKRRELNEIQTKNG